VSQTDPAESGWLVSAICAECLDSDLGRHVLAGSVGVATVNRGPVDRCVLCGWLLADEPAPP
jgi:hypothetical protein